LLLVHVKTRSGTTLPFMSRPIADICSVCPTATLPGDGETVTDGPGGGGCVDVVVKPCAALQTLQTPVLSL
jgi:hypothetical protein